MIEKKIRLIIFAVTYPRIYFELISKNNWDRFRIEGTTCGLVPIYRPGKYEMKLNCLRIKPKSLTENLKRYFIGDYMSCNDITWYGLPSLINGNDDKVNFFLLYQLDAPKKKKSEHNEPL